MVLVVEAVVELQCDLAPVGRGAEPSDLQLLDDQRVVRAEGTGTGGEGTTGAEGPRSVQPVSKRDRTSKCE